MGRTPFAKELMRVGLALTIVAFAATTFPAFAQGVVRDEVSDLLNKHDEALNQHNADALMALYSSRANTVMMGTGPGEKFQGQSEIKAAYAEIFKDFDKGTLTHECYWKSPGGSGNVVWGAAMCKFTDSKAGKKREFELNISAVAEKRAGKWQFVLLHYSNIVGSSTPGN